MRSPSAGTSRVSSPPCSLDVGAEERLRSVLDVVGERLDPGLVGQRELLVAAAVEHGRPWTRASSAAWMERRDLPIPGSPEMSARRHSASTASSNSSARPPALGGAPHEAARRHLLQAGRQRQRRPFLAERLPGDLDGVDRLGESFQRELADRLECLAVSSAREMGDELLGQDLAALGAVAKACRLDHRHAEVVAVGHGRVADAEAHPDRELLVGSAVAALEALLDHHRARDRLRGAVEGDEQAVACVLDLAPARLVTASRRRAKCSARSSSAAPAPIRDSSPVEPTRSVIRIVTV